MRWQRAGVPDDVDIPSVRRLPRVPVLLFAFVLAFAAAMARGYGEF